MKRKSKQTLEDQKQIIQSENKSKSKIKPPTTQTSIISPSQSTKSTNVVQNSNKLKLISISLFSLFSCIAIIYGFWHLWELQTQLLNSQIQLHATQMESLIAEFQIEKERLEMKFLEENAKRNEFENEALSLRVVIENYDQALKNTNPMEQLEKCHSQNAKLLETIQSLNDTIIRGNFTNTLSEEAYRVCMRASKVQKSAKARNQKVQPTNTNNRYSQTILNQVFGNATTANGNGTSTNSTGYSNHIKIVVE